MRLAIVVLTSGLILAQFGCATTGPLVTRGEVDLKRAELHAKAEQFRALQLKRVEAIANRIISYMPAEDRKKLEGLRYEVSSKPDINAYASWNKLTVTHLMLRFTESDEELGVVIGHELAHIVKGHMGKRLGTHLVASALGVVAGGTVEGITQGSGLGGSVANGVSKGVAGGFSREFEREADYYGFQYAYLAGFDLLKGITFWERLAIEAPKAMTVDLFSTHPSYPERLIRAEKTLQELQTQGIQPNLFRRPGQISSRSYGSGPVGQILSLPVKAASIPSQVLGSVGQPSFVPSSASTSSAGQSSQPKVEHEQLETELTQAQEELMALREEIRRLRAGADEERAQTADQARRAAIEQEELERTLLEAKEASKQLRHVEFGVQDIGLAKRVTNLWVGKKVSGEQRIFSVREGSIDWFVQYDYWSANSFKALAMQHRKYRAYWYSPDSRLFSDQEFMQSKVRAEFAKATLKWDPNLGDFLVGQWTLRVFENGKLLDERTFELVK